MCQGKGMNGFWWDPTNFCIKAISYCCNFIVVRLTAISCCWKHKNLKTGRCTFLLLWRHYIKLTTISKKWHNVRRLVTSFRILKVFLKDTLYVWIRLCLKSIQLITSGHSKCRSQQFILLFQMFYKLMPNCCYYISLLIFSVTDEGCSNSLCSV